MEGSGRDFTIQGPVVRVDDEVSSAPKMPKSKKRKEPEPKKPIRRIEGVSFVH